MKRIVCFHLLNDYSGSPKVLNMALKGLLEKEYRIDLVTSQKGGVLDELNSCERIKIYRYSYAFSNNSIVTILRYLYVLVYTFFFSFRYLFQRNIIFLLNTLMPVGPALAGKIMGKKVIYYYHENAFVKGCFYKILAFMMQWLADEIICVSDYQCGFLKRKEHVVVIPNSLSADFENRCEEIRELDKDCKTVLMLSSLKLYKGTLEFIQLTQRLPQYHFVLVINDTQENINIFCSEYNIPCCNNLEVWDRQSDVIPFYKKASIVLNLSNKKDFVETFGLTALEAMTAGIPVIVPTEGGISELVEDGVNGYKIDVQDLDRIEQTIIQILSDKQMYRSLSENAIKLSAHYDYNSMINRIDQLLRSV